MAWVNGKTDIVEWEKIGKDVSALMLKQCETLLKETIETAKTISTRAEKLISIILPIVSALIVYVIKNGWCEITSYLSITAIVTIAVLLTSLIYAYKAFKPYDVYISGEYPKNIVTSELLNTDLPKSEQYLTVFLNICENIQLRIDNNDTRNEMRQKDINASLKALALLTITPIVSLIVYLFFLEHHCG